MQKKVAVVGAGISGLGAAWMLKESGFDVTVFEPRPVAGGQMESFEVTSSTAEKARFDMYIVCLAQSHNMRALGAHWNLPLTEYDYGVYYANGDYSWGNYQHTEFLLSHRHECERFVHLLTELYEEDASLEASAITVKEFLDHHGFSDDFNTHILCPLLATLLDVPKEHLNRFAIGLFAEIFATGMLSFLDSPRMYRFRDGMSAPVQALAAALDGCIRYNTAVQKITRHADQVELLDATGAIHFFDEVVLSCNFQQCQNLLSDLTYAERDVFDRIKYYPLRLLVHEDGAALQAPESPLGQFVTLHKGHTISNPVLEYGHDFRLHQGVYASSVMGEMDPGIAPEKVLLDQTYHLEMIDVESVVAKAQLRYLQGSGHVWYCGLSTVPGLSECCLASGFVVAEQLGARYPFEHLPDAKAVFENIKNFMFGGTPSLRMLHAPAAVLAD